MRSWSFPHLRKAYTRFLFPVKWQIFGVHPRSIGATLLAAALLAPLAAGGWLTLRESLLAIVIVAAVIAPADSA